jgi:hypothetical protein
VRDARVGLSEETLIDESRCWDKRTYVIHSQELFDIIQYHSLPAFERENPSHSGRCVSRDSLGDGRGSEEVRLEGIEA